MSDKTQRITEAKRRLEAIQSQFYGTDEITVREATEYNLILNALQREMGWSEEGGYPVPSA